MLWLHSHGDCTRAQASVGIVGSGLTEIETLSLVKAPEVKSDIDVNVSWCFIYCGGAAEVSTVPLQSVSGYTAAVSG
jgi:hypothetical protein